MMNHKIYFPHNVDFRGRAYPLPQHLNHIGNDLSRGLLLFADRKPLTASGLRWLKIHIANLSGNDKISFEDRVLYTESMHSQIIDSANDPLGGGRWWMKGMDKPFQLLGACIEYRNAYQHPGGPERYRSGLPVHQDGTCNGLQHYAALGGDVVGAEQVNLKKGKEDKPGDVYSGVAEVVKGLVDEDFEAGVEEARLMKGRIIRKVVKQTVMTNTYGVTFLGARDQVRNRLKEARADQLRDGAVVGGVDEKGMKVLTDEEIARCSIYTARKLFEGMGKVFEGARGIQGWLNECARVVSGGIDERGLDRDILEE
ncbi:DNA-directed RNA polymerase, partial [Rhizophlyctis rosea]